MMTEAEVMGFADVLGYNPERRDSDRWYLSVQTKDGREYRGFGLHVLRDPSVPGNNVLLIHSRGRMTFRAADVVEAAWYHVAPWTQAAEKVA